MSRSYDELSELSTFEDRYRYLALRGEVGAATFGFDRWVNQRFYQSREWRGIRDYVITRDEGCDLGILGYEIHDRLYIHHMNPMSLRDITEGDPRILDLNNLITCTHSTHNAIHYGDESKLAKPLVERRPGDTKLW
jgi:5-methylcytosine-specific restriction endonuclease McrA